MYTDQRKAILHRYLRLARETMLWKLDGVSDFDVRRALTPTGTNLLGLIKHLAVLELDYFGTTFGRPHDEILAWAGREREPNEDMYATAEESREDILGLYERAVSHSDATIQALELDAQGRVPWWPDDVNPVDLQWIIVHMTAETNRHLGQADILRERLDGVAGFRNGAENVPQMSDEWWTAYVRRIDEAAQRTR